MEDLYHCPVMLRECIEALAIEPASTYVDLTFGGGGHSREIMKFLGPKGSLVGFDQDTDALKNSIEDDRFLLVNQNFNLLMNYLRLYKKLPVQGILADLGVSSHQFNVPQRGFSIRESGPLDMRMDKRTNRSAADVLANASLEELCSIFRLYGEIPNAWKLSKAICLRREEKAFETTTDLLELLGKFAQRGKENKYFAMAFQALRIEVNQELENLKLVLQQSLSALGPKGRLVVLSYHSLEDRLVKNFLKSGNFKGEIEKDFYGKPLVPFNLIHRKVVLPSPEEILENPRARSAKLRVAEKI